MYTWYPHNVGSISGFTRIPDKLRSIAKQRSKYSGSGYPCTS